jgi:hypothetical protein
MLRSCVYWIAFGLLSLSTWYGAVAQSWPPSKESASQAVLKWLQQNSAHGPDSNFVNDMSQLAKDEIENGMSINFFFGSELMESGQFKSLSVFCNQVVPFDMTESQASAMELESSSVTTTTSGAMGVPAEKQSFQISNLMIDGGDSLGPHAKITGSIHCKALTDAGGKEYAIRISHRGNQGASQFKYLDSVPDASGQTLSFEFDPINEEGAGEEFTGPVAMLCDIVTVDSSGGDVQVTVHSNMVGSLVTISR